MQSAPPHEADVPLKIRRVTKACDLCRKRKARCDGEPTSNKPCTLCENSGVACVFTRFARKRGHESSQARQLETRIIELESIIRLMAPGIDIDQEIDDSANSSDSAEFLRPSDSAFLHHSDAFLRPSPDSTSAFFHPSYTQEQEIKPDLSALQGLQPISPIDEYPAEYSRPGTSAGAATGDAYARSGTSQAYAQPGPAVPTPGSSYSVLSPPPSAGPSTTTTNAPPPRSLRSELSYTEGSEITIGLEIAQAWKREIQPQAARRNSRQTNPAEYQGSYTKPLRDKLPTRVAPQDLWFPPDDLLNSLVDLYFTRFNVLLPLLHRPTFEAQLKQKLHWRDPSFAAVVLLVCANGSRFSDDTRVMPFYSEDVPEESREFEAGILFYRQVDVCSIGVFPVDVLFEHQIVTLGAMYMTIGNPSAVLVATGVSLRLGMQRGVHRNAWQGEVNTHHKALNDEMWRRAFWCSYVLDVLFSTFYGRPTSVLTDQYDLPPPTPVEGEDPQVVNGFRHFVKLCEVLTEITRTMYHFAQILIRRPYAMIPTMDDSAGKSLFEESRAICLRAARTNAMMLGHYVSLNRRPMPWLTPSTRETLVMLVMNGLHLHKSSPSGVEGESEKEQAVLLQYCVDILQLMGRVGVHVADMANMLRELATPINPSQSP
ncbi:Fungal specific transcription factor domain [Ceratobasidium sp. AG-Ba]|nr:Fungal specific transcription factor domain [Ceratobasidium sp. AG-Ba]